MVKSSADTPEAYLAGLSPERREIVSAVRGIIQENLPAGYEEGMQYGMIGYHVPPERYPDTYNGLPLCVISLAAQKNYISLYLMGVCYDPETERWFEERLAASGKKLDMGKSCLRFRELGDLPLDVVAEAVARVSPEDLIRRYEASRVG